jgi:hypothetical protein
VLSDARSLTEVEEEQAGSEPRMPVLQARDAMNLDLQQHNRKLEIPIGCRRRWPCWYVTNISEQVLLDEIALKFVFKCHYREYPNVSDFPLEVSVLSLREIF